MLMYKKVLNQTRIQVWSPYLHFLVPLFSLGLARIVQVMGYRGAAIVRTGVAIGRNGCEHEIDHCKDPKCRVMACIAKLEEELSQKDKKLRAQRAQINAQGARNNAQRAKIHNLQGTDSFFRFS